MAMRVCDHYRVFLNSILSFFILTTLDITLLPSKKDKFLSLSFTPKESRTLDVLIGKEIKIPHFEAELTLKLPQLMDIKKEYILKGKGMKQIYEYNGNLIVKIEIESPKMITEEQKKVLKELNKEENFKIN